MRSDALEILADRRREENEIPRNQSDVPFLNKNESQADFHS